MFREPQSELYKVKKDLWKRSSMATDPTSTSRFRQNWNSNSFLPVFVLSRTVVYFLMHDMLFQIFSGDDDINVIMGTKAGYATSYVGGASASGADSSYADSSNTYHTALGKTVAIAFNDRTFNTYSSIPRNDMLRHYNWYTRIDIYILHCNQSLKPHA